MRRIALSLLWLLVSLGANIEAQESRISPKIRIQGLLKDSAYVYINGKQRLLRKGSRAVDGVRLLESNSRFALVEVNGEVKKLFISQNVGSQFTKPKTEKTHIASGKGGHYRSPGRINSRPVSFMVDTGATSIAMNSEIAKSLGINYKKGRPIQVQTASGFAKAYQVNLRSVSVGTIELNNVSGFVVDGGYPSEILLGNSYLSRVDLQINNGVMILQAKF